MNLLSKIKDKLLKLTPRIPWYSPEPVTSKDPQTITFNTPSYKTVVKIKGDNLGSVINFTTLEYIHGGIRRGLQFQRPKAITWLAQHLILVSKPTLLWNPHVLSLKWFLKYLSLGPVFWLSRLSCFVMLASHMSAGCSISGPTPCFFAWESKWKWLMYLGPCNSHGDLDGIQAPGLGLAQPWSLLQFGMWITGWEKAPFPSLLSVTRSKKSINLKNDNRKINTVNSTDFLKTCNYF